MVSICLIKYEMLKENNCTIRFWLFYLKVQEQAKVTAQLLVSL